MIDKLIELLSQKYDHFCDQCGINKESHYIENLADYLIANCVIVPPCKVGDTVYRPIITDTTREPAIYTIIVTRIYVILNKNGVSPHSYAVGRIKNTSCGESFDFEEIGKTVFLTKEEAERAFSEAPKGDKQ